MKHNDSISAQKDSVTISDDSPELETDNHGKLPPADQGSTCFEKSRRRQKDWF
jgi:hypothetical protein